MTTVLSREEALGRLLGTVKEAMTGEVVTLAAETPADVAVRCLEQSGVSGAPVIDHGRVVGVITLRDLLDPVASGVTEPKTTGPFLRYEHHLAGLVVRELMTREPACARTDWPLGRVVLLMDEAGVNRIPVTNLADEAVGILTRDDVLRALARLLRGGRPPARAACGSVLEPD